MNTYPDNVKTTQIVCALRFQGYDYEQATGIAVEGITGGGLGGLIKPVIETLTLHVCQEDNFAAFFGLQRYLFKWGGERLTKYSEEHIAFDFLFLHLYRIDTPPRFSNAKYILRWNKDCLDTVEESAAIVRASFRRLGRGKKVHL